MLHLWQKKDTLQKQCKSKKKTPTKLLQIIEEPEFYDEYYTWFNK